MELYHSPNIGCQIQNADSPCTSKTGDAGSFLELPFAPPHFVQVHNVVGKETVQLLIGLVYKDEDEIEPKTVVEKVKTLLKERTSLIIRVFGPGE